MPRRHDEASSGKCADLLVALPPAVRARARRRRAPAWVQPMLATLVATPFSDPGWVYERKLDGVRCVAFRRGRAARLFSRNRLALGEAFPELVAAVAALPCDDFVADGEIVAFDGPLTSFARLQLRLGARAGAPIQRAVPVRYYLFDLLHLAGHDLTALPLLARKQLLRALLERGRGGRALRYTPHRREHGERFLQVACESAWEGLIAKRADAPYVPRRSRDWLKLKCVNRQEFVVGGYTDPRGARTGFGALLVGVYAANGALRYAGKVGTGYDGALLSQLSRRLARMATDRSPFQDPPRERAHWVRPALVAEVGFTEWTRDGRLRHPRFLGLRTDKDPRKVVRERPA